MTGPGPLCPVPTQGFDPALDGGHSTAHLLAQRVVPLLQRLVALLQRLDPVLQLLVALPLPGRSRADALLQRTLQGLPHPPGQLPRLRALGHRPLV